MKCLKYGAQTSFLLVLLSDISTGGTGRTPMTPTGDHFRVAPQSSTTPPVVDALSVSLMTRPGMGVWWSLLVESTYRFQLRCSIGLGLVDQCS